MKIPGVYVEIKGDSTQLKKDIGQARQYVTEQAKGMSDSVNNALSTGQIKGSINSLVANLGTLSRSSKVASQSFSEIGVDLKEMKKLTGVADGEFAKLQSRLLRTQAAKAQTKALTSISQSAGLTKKEISALGRQFGLSRSAINAVNTSVNRASTSMFTLGNAAKAAFAYLSFQTVTSAARNVIAVADEYALLDSKIKLVTKDSEEFGQVYSELFAISQTTGSSFANNAANYSNLSLALKDTNITSSETLKIFEDVNKSLVVAGATTAESASFMLQFRQAMGSGKLAGDEFRGMMESNSYWGGQLAKALDTDVAGLRKMSKEGKLTTDVLRKAFPAMSLQISKDFDGITKTIGRAMTELKNAINDVIADSNKAVGGTSSIATAVSELASTISENKDAISGLFVGLIKSGSLAVEGIEKVVAAWEYLYNISDAQAKGYSFAEIFGMSPEELENVLSSTDKYKARISELKGTISETSVALASLYEKRDRKGLNDTEEKTVNVYKAQIEQVKSLIEILQRKAELEGTPTITAGHSKKILEEASTAEKGITTVTDKESKNRIRIRTDERSIALEMSKDRYQDTLAAEKKATDQISKLRTSVTDKVKELSLSETEYKKAQLDAEVAKMREVAGTNKELQDDISQYYKLKLEEIAGTADTMANKMKESWSSYTDSVKDDAKTVLGDYLNGEFDSLDTGWSDFCEKIKKKWKSTLAQLAIDWAASKIGDWLKEDSGSSGSSSSDDSWWDTVKGWFKSSTGGPIAAYAGGGAIAAYAGGGVLQGGSGLRDDIYGGKIGGKHFLLQGGEFVISKDRTQKNRGLLEAINAGKIEQRATGGSVGSKAYVFKENDGSGSLSDIAASTQNVSTANQIAAETSITSSVASEAATVAKEKETEATNKTATSLDDFVQGVKNLGNELKDSWDAVKASKVGSVTSAVGTLTTGKAEALLNTVAAVGYTAYKYATGTTTSGTDTSGGLSEAAIQTASTGIASSDYAGEAAAQSGSSSDDNDDKDFGDRESSPGGMGGVATGGIIDKVFTHPGMKVPAGDDGFRAVALGEGVIDRDTMTILSKLIRGGGLGSGVGDILVKIYLDGKELKQTIDKVIVKREKQGVQGAAYI